MSEKFRSEKFHSGRFGLVACAGCAVVMFSWLLVASPAKSVPIDENVESVEFSPQDSLEPDSLESESLEADIWAEEIPEEILRTEIITGARSPLTGEPLSAAEYAQLQAELADSAGEPLVSEDLRYLIFLLQVRRAVKPIIPFL